MAIDKSAQPWTGDAASDVDEYLRLIRARDYPVDRIARIACRCGGAQFRVLVDADEGCAQRVCTRCSAAHLICDSDEIWDDADPETMACSCGNQVFDVAVGFSDRRNGDVRWITIGVRCVECGVLGSPVDWKIDYAPTDHLYDRA